RPREISADALGSLHWYGVRQPWTFHDLALVIGEPATIQFTRGGFRKDGSVPTYGTTEMPLSSIRTDGITRWPSSLRNSEAPSFVRYVTVQMTIMTRMLARCDIAKLVMNVF